MNQADFTFSTLTNDQLSEVQALESKISLLNANGHDTVLIAYATPERS